MRSLALRHSIAGIAMMAAAALAAPSLVASAAAEPSVAGPAVAGPPLAPPGIAAVDPAASAAALATLKTVLAHRPASLAALADQPFATIALTKVDAAVAHTLLWTAHLDEFRRQRARELASGVIRDGSVAMPFTVRAFGARPARGHSLWISLHGGGDVAHEDNDAQWRNQQTLYSLDEGFYVAPRAPTDAWNMWMQGHIDRLLTRLIEDMIALRGVDPDRVYLLGYGAGGDGVYQLAPRMADTWAAAAMMAGHPNGSAPLGLRNVPFAVQTGALDTAYDRNLAAADYGAQLDRLRAADPGGYPHFVKLHPDKGSWMDLQDAEALPWMAGFPRNARPDRVAWRQDGVAHDRSYWLAVPPAEARGGALAIARWHGAQFDIEAADKLGTLLIHLDDRMTDLDQSISVTYQGKRLFVGTAVRTIGTMLRTLADRGDPALMFDAEIAVTLPADPK